MVGHQVKKGYNMRLISSGFYLPYNPELVQRAREMRQNPTPTEKKLWYGFLKLFKFRVFRQMPIDNYIVDLNIARLKLVIEIDGENHFTNVGKEYDEARTKTLDGYDLRAIRFTNQEVLNNFESVCQAIQEIPPIPLTKGGKGGSDRSPL
jgi:very-short-patch-repair endonuclease